LARTWQQRRGPKPRLAPYLFVAPFVVLFLVFTAYPTVLAVSTSLQHWTGTGERTFIGLANYARLARDPSFGTALANSLWFAAAAVILIVPVAFVLANILNLRWLRFRAALRIAFFIPIGITTVVIAMVFVVLYDEHYGAVNYMLNGLGIPSVDLIGEPGFVKPAILGLLLWQWTSIPMVYFLAGLQSISREVEEAAELDGAGVWTMLRRIRLPLLAPITLLVVVLLSSDAIRMFDQVFILMFFSGAPGQTSGGPGEQGLTLMLYLYRTAFRFRDLGTASAVGIVVLLISLVIAAGQMARFGSVGRWRASRRRRA
jgi:multiple sugar transport system permease protein